VSRFALGALLSPALVAGAQASEIVACACGRAICMDERMARPSRPVQLGRHEVIAKIAGGGLAAVYLGRSLDVPSQLVALKVARQDLGASEEIRALFLDEGRLLRRLVHPGIVRTLDVGVGDGHTFIAMELLLGVSLEAVQRACLARGRGLHPLLAAWIAARVAEALDYAHRLTDEGHPLGVVHRDVNPSNVLLTFDGRVKLIDFGLAKSRGRLTTSSPGIVKGKLPYLSPEQIMQLPLDGRSDVFCLGTTLWEMLTVRHLFVRGTDDSTIRAVHRGAIPDPREVAPDVPVALSPIVLRALERNRDFRHPTAAALARELSAFVVSHGGRRLPEHLEATLGELFPDELRRQRGWTKPTMGPPPSKRVA
jgi:serine/threonine protein kinase